MTFSVLRYATDMMCEHAVLRVLYQFAKGHIQCLRGKLCPTSYEGEQSVTAFFNKMRHSSTDCRLQYKFMIEIMSMYLLLGADISQITVPS